MLLAPSSSVQTEEWKEIACIPHTHAILAIGLSRPNPSAFYTGTAVNVTKIQRSDYTGSVLVSGGGAPVKAILVNRDGRIAIAKEHDLEIWKDDTRIHLIEFEDTISAAAWESNLIAVAVQSNVLIYDSMSMTLIRSTVLSNIIQSLSISPTSGIILAQSSSRIYLWRPESDEVEEQRSSLSSSLSCAAVGDLKAFFGCSDGTCFTLDLTRPLNQPIKSLFGHTNNVRSVQVSRDDRKALSASWDCSLRVWCLQTGETLRVLNHVHDSYVTVGRFFGKDDSYIVSGSSDKTMKIFDLYFADRERLLALASGRKHPHLINQFPIEVLRLIKSMLF